MKEKQFNTMPRLRNQSRGRRATLQAATPGIIVANTATSFSASVSKAKSRRAKIKGANTNKRVPVVFVQDYKPPDKPPMLMQSHQDSLACSENLPLELYLRAILRVFSPTSNDQEYARQVLRDMNRALSGLDMHALVFGSWCTGISTPSSDMDFVAIQQGSRMPPGSGSSAFHNNGSGKYSTSSVLERALFDPVTASTMSRKERHKRFSGALRLVGSNLRFSMVFRSIQLIPNAKVPVVKALHRGGKSVDVSFLRDGLMSSQFLCEEFKKPQFLLARGIIILVKALVANWMLDDPSVGGLGSFPISIMVLWFLHEEVAQRYPPEVRKSYAVCLVGFLKYYGLLFDYKHTGIDYANKRTFVKTPVPELYILNPLNPSANCAAAATLFVSRLVKKFGDTYTLFSRLLEDTTDAASLDKAVLEAFDRPLRLSGAQGVQRLQREKQRQLPESETGYQHRWEADTSLYIGDPLGN
ncbi:DNA polymerase sigma-like protein [Trypanosoma rangeli]|uniref:DNA polymerase sigma-like protein n=1 Tax=Trypanosoma rangeli TaxID=5698 RepID=A0A3S5IS02_TRYRA|nr:DNA polymerase sigma-like protein [Trypanosoma rangeli]RNF09468.1 DNA polymerase sigma-like protein [Trypanosoma rangeli]|eukprot:RNF09468.1 DNA polymerase sigma-like protein [Trypanosoma rangeli]